MKKKTLLLAALATFGMALTGCDIDTLTPSSSQPIGGDSSVVERDADIERIYKLYVGNGGTLSYEEWLSTIKGEPGKDGTSFRCGSGAPSADLGNDGDSYVDLTTWDYYIKAAGSWNKSGNLKGAQGEQGPQGEKGDQGSSGQNGANGKSAYEIYCEAHPDYKGDEQQWLDDLVNGRLGTEEKNVYTVTFDLGYDGLSFAREVEEGQKVGKPETPIRNGYKFVDWVDENGDHWVFNGFSITKDLTLYAIWSDPIEYTVTFVNNGGTILDVESGYYGETVTYHGISPVAENQDPHYVYTFSGWSEELVIVGNMTITAQYASKYIATTAYFYDEDGTTLLSTVSLGEGEAPIYAGETPFKERDRTKKIHFQFARWNKTEETSESIKLVAEYVACTDDLFIENGAVTSYKGSSTEVVVPYIWDGTPVTTIAVDAFKGNKTLQSVFLPDSIRTLPEQAFANCTALNSVRLPSSLTSLSKGCFSGCSALSTITLPDSMKSIDESALSGCKALTSLIIPENVSFIGGYAFSGCSSLPSIAFPENINTIENGVFSGCSSLTSFAIPESVTSIGNYAFSSSGILSITLPDSVTSIGEYSFYNCASLKSIVILKSVKKIGDSAFKSCSSLTIYCEEEKSASLPAGWNAQWNPSKCGIVWGFRQFGDEKDFSYYIYEEYGEKSACITGYTGLDKEHVDIPSYLGGAKVVQIKKFLSSKDETGSIKSVHIPECVSFVSGNCFTNCNGKTKFLCEAPSKPEGWNPSWDEYRNYTQYLRFSVYWGVTKAGLKNGFLYYTTAEDSLILKYYGETTDNLVIPSIIDGTRINTIADYAFEKNSQLTSVSIEEGINAIGRSAFADCSSLASVSFPSTLSKINSYAFSGCTSLGSAMLPDGVTFVGSYAFKGCSSLSTVKIPSSVITMQDYVFSGCGKAKAYCSPASRPDGWSSYLGGVSIFWGVEKVIVQDFIRYAVYNDEGNRYAKVVGYEGKPINVVLPDTVDDAPVSVVADSAFSNCASLLTIKLSNNLISIESRAFSGCSSLASVTISDSVASIGDYAFSDCTSLTSVSIPNSVTYIGSRAFHNCTNLDGVHQDGAIYLGSEKNPHLYLHRLESTSVTSYTLPNKCRFVGDQAFKDCTRLTSVLFSRNVTSIGWYAFSGCTSLASVSIPASVTSIGDNAFASCSSLLSVTFESVTPPSIGSDLFSVTWNNDAFKIFVPAEGLEAYKAVTARYWQDYAVSHIVGYKTPDAPSVALTLEINGAEVNLAPEENPGDNAAVYKVALAIGDKLVVKGDGVALPLGDSELTEFTCTVAGEHTVYVNKEYKVYLVVPAS